MDAQLGEIKMLLQAQAEEKAAKEGKAAKTDVGDEEAIYVAIQNAAGVHFSSPSCNQVHIHGTYDTSNDCIFATTTTGISTDIPFKRFVLAFESFFLAGEDMAPEVSKLPGPKKDKFTT